MSVSFISIVSVLLANLHDSYHACIKLSRMNSSHSGFRVFRLVDQIPMPAVR